MKTALVLGAALALAGCGAGSNSASENVAGQLDDAAEQSTPEAAAVLHNEADAIENDNSGAGEADAQQALQNAGDAQIGNVH
jgi:hypothetical protein